MQRVGVLLSILCMRAHREWLWCLIYSVYVALHTGCGFIYRGCDVRSTVVWWHTELIWCYIECIWFHTYSGYDVTQKVGVMLYKSGFDISAEILMTKIQWVLWLIQGIRCHAWSGWDIINTVVWVDRVDVMSAAVQMMSHICRVWYQQHTVLCCHTQWIWCHKYNG